MLTENFFFIAQLYSILHVLIIVLFLGHILRVRKTPTSTFAWFFLVLIQPIVGLSLYLIFGSRKMRAVRTPLAVAEAHHFTDPIQRLLLNSGSQPPCDNTDIRILSTGEEAFAELLSRIKHAKKCIYIETFIFSGDEVGLKVLGLLARKAQEGVDVRILVDAFGNLLQRLPNFREFKNAGGKVAKFMPLLHRPFRGRANLRNHRKLIIFDHEIAITGGMNIAHEYMGDSEHPDRWVDIGLLSEGPLVAQMEKIFWEDWIFAGGQVPRKMREHCFPSTPTEHYAQVVSSGPDVPSDPLYEWLLTTLYIAKKRIWITTPYFVPDESLAKALELAAKRGVDVRLLIPKKSNHLLADLGRKTYLDQVQAAGVKIYQFPRMIHAKLTLIDESYGLISSANFDSRSLLLNYELGICLYSRDDLNQMEEWCEKLFRQCSVGVDSAGAIDQWIGGFARLISPLI